jgi:hypothetical protein
VRTVVAMRGRAALLTVVLAALMVAACGRAEPGLAPAPLATPWAAAAERRIEAELAAARSGAADFARYFAEEVKIADAWGLGPVDGRDQLRERLSVLRGVRFEELGVEELLVDRQGAVLVEQVAGVADALLEVRGYGRSGVLDAQLLYPHAGRGADSPPVIPGGPLPPGGETETGTMRLVERYLAVWAGERRWTEELYTRDARLSDDVLGLDLVGRAAIVAHAASSVPRSAGGRHGARAAAASGDVWATPDGALVALITDADHGQGCPGRQVAVLEVSGGSIRSERRLRAIDDVRRCVDDPPGGWWDVLVEPEPLDTITGHVRVAGARVPVRGSSPAMDAALAWAIGRFVVAGLSAPALGSVTFASATGRCGDVAGRIDQRRCPPADVLLCLDEDQVCADAACTAYRFAARATMLHELAHVWETDALGEADRAAYLELVGLGSWMGAQVPWEQRGGERAAEVLMWGLLEREVPLVRFGAPSCGQLRAEFVELTAAEPLWGACVD